MDTSKSEFYHFGILPAVCIFSPIEDEYSKMYIPRRKCECGCLSWVISTMKLIEDLNGYEFPKKLVHRCSECNEVRMSDHIGVKEELASDMLKKTENLNISPEHA